MNTTPSDTKPTFTPEQTRTLGRLYGFLIELGKDRQRRMEKQINGKMTVNNKIPDLPQDQIERDMEPPG